MAKNPISVAAGKKAWEHVDDWKISQVVADLPQGIEIGHRASRKGLKVMIWSGEEHIGTLHIGQGGIQWSYRNKKYREMDWRTFAAKMES